MEEWALVTGASRGIGKAVVFALAETFPSLRIMAISRTIFPFPDSRIQSVAADLTTDSGRVTVQQAMSPHKFRYAVHSAGLIGTQGFQSTTIESYRKVMNLNVETPLFLTQSMTSLFLPGARILMIGSLAGKEYMLQSPSYCISKAGLFMLHQILNAELSEVRTGVVM